MNIICASGKKIFLISFPSILRQNIARSESTSQEPGQKLQDIGTNITHTSFVGGKSKTIKVFSSVGECLAKMFCQQLSGENKSGLLSNGLAAKSSFGQCMLFRRIVVQLYWVLSLLIIIYHHPDNTEIQQRNVLAPLRVELSDVPLFTITIHPIL